MIGQGELPDQGTRPIAQRELLAARGGLEHGRVGGPKRSPATRTRSRVEGGPWNERPWGVPLHAHAGRLLVASGEEAAGEHGRPHGRWQTGPNGPTYHQRTRSPEYRPRPHRRRSPDVPPIDARTSPLRAPRGHPPQRLISEGEYRIRQSALWLSGSFRRPRTASCGTGRYWEAGWAWMLAQR
jgi:hypothetical protein